MVGWWPFVHRARLEAVQAELAYAQAARQAAESRVDALLTQLTAATTARLEAERVRAEAYSGPLPEPVLASPLPAVVREAIAERAVPHSPSWRHLEAEARRRLELEVDPREVVALILNGEPVEW